jgi:Heme NO binding associated
MNRYANFQTHSQLYSINLAKKAKELSIEQKKSDALLFQMLPTSVAERLKQEGSVSSWKSFFKFIQFKFVVFL